METAAFIVGIAQIIVESSTSSESDSDSDEIQEILRILQIDRRDYVPRIRCERYVENVVYRLRRNTFYFILDQIRPMLERHGQLGRTTISSEKQLLVALWVMATPNSYRCISDRFDIGKATAWRAVRRVVNALYSLLPTFITWPTREEASRTWNAVREKSEFPKVIGAVDGTHIRIAAPKMYPDAYINRKGYHSLQLQVICDSDLKFMHCYTGEVGSVHDARVFTLSGVYDLCTENYFYENSHILGDAAYTIDPCVMIPFKDNGHLTESHIKYNICHAKGRVMVERALGLLKARFCSILDRLSMTRTDLIPKYIIACCILHNICILQKDFIEIPIILNEPQIIPHNNIDNRERKNQGREKRNAIMYSLMNGNVF